MNAGLGNFTAIYLRGELLLVTLYMGYTPMYIKQLNPWLMEFGGSQGLSNIHILSRINPIPRIDTYLFKVHSNIVLPPTPRPP